MLSEQRIADDILRMVFHDLTLGDDHGQRRISLTIAYLEGR